MRSIVPTVTALFCLSAPLRAEVNCPAIFSDHMVLQRDKPVTIWGTAAPDERVTVEFAAQNRATNATADGRWQVQLAPLAASDEGRTLTVRGQNTLTFSDVLVGEVWFCSGQSNMEKPLGPRKGQKPTDNYEAEICGADFPRLRLFQMPHYGKPQKDVDGLRWAPCSPETVASAQFSAAAYFFGREIHRELGVPVGLIHSSFGGSMIEAWMPRNAFATAPELRGLADRRYSAWVEGVQATELFQSMVAPLAPFTVRGFLWYQGEANCMNGDTAIYAAKQRALIRAWREVWHDAEAPFFHAQLAPFNYSAWESFPKKLTPLALPLFWEAQTAALDAPHTGMIVTTDLAGSAKDIHPTNKRDVGLRFARLALHDTYGRHDVVARGPEFVGFRIRGATIAITFRHTDGGLKSRGEGPLSGFTIAGADHNFVPANAEIRADTVVVGSPAVSQPVAVRFGWHETISPNLVNGAGLPSRPFRTDDWSVQNLRAPIETPAEP